MQLNDQQNQLLEKKRQELEADLPTQAEDGYEAEWTDKLRMMGQGLTFGFGDELEAIFDAATNGDVTYEQAVQAARQKIADYKQNDKWGAMGYEALGALPTIAVGPLAAAKGLGMLGRAAGEGALYAAGSQDGTVGERIAAMPGGAMGGAIGGAAGSAAGSVVGAGLSGVYEFARRKLGDKGASVVAREVQRLVELTGKTPDEVLQDVADGSIMAENKTLQHTARAYKSSNTPAQSVIVEGMQNRPMETRARAMNQAQEVITPGIKGDDVIVQGKDILETERKAAGAQYGPGKTQNVGDELRVELADTLERIPSAAEAIKKALDLKLKGKDLYTVAKRDDGSSYIIFNHEPTVAEAEVIRSTINNIKDKAFREGEGTFGSGLAPVEDNLRSVIDRVSPETADAREAYRIAKNNREAFDKGVKALSGDTFEMIDYIRKLSPEQRQAFKVGFMSHLRNTATSGISGARVARDIANDEGATQRILLELLPEDQAEMVIKQFRIAKQSQEATNKVLSDSATEGTRVAKGGIGSNTDIADAVVRAATGDMSGLLLQTRKLVAENTSLALTDQQAKEVAEYLVETNPKYIAEVLQDEGKLADFQRYIEKFGTMMTKQGRVAGAQNVGGLAGGETSPLLIHVTKALAED